MQTPHPDPTPEHETWTTAAETYSDVIGKTTLHGTRRLVSTVNSVSPLSSASPPSRAIDAGCGTGSLTVSIKNLSPSTPVLAIDISQGMLTETSSLALPGVTTLLSDAASLAELPDGSFSHALSSFAIQFAPDPSACVRSLCRVTAPGGIVGIAIWGEMVGPAELHERACANLDPGYAVPPQTGRASWHDEGRHRGELESAGLEGVGTEVVEMPFEAGGAEGVVEYWFRSANPVPRRLVGHWIESGRSGEELEKEYERLVRGVYGRGERVVCEAVLGWGRKPGV